MENTTRHQVYAAASHNIHLPEAQRAQKNTNLFKITFYPSKKFGTLLASSQMSHDIYAFIKPSFFKLGGGVEIFIAQNTPFWKCQKVSLKQHQKLHIPIAQDCFNFHHETKRDTDLFLCIMLILINVISRNTLTRSVYPHKPTNSDCSTRCLSTLWWDFAVLMRLYFFNVSKASRTALAFQEINQVTYLYIRLVVVFTANSFTGGHNITRPS